MMEKYLQLSIFREPPVVEMRQCTCSEKHSGASRKKAKVIRPARMAALKLLKRVAFAINLGGTTEAVFRPMLGQKMAFIS